MYSGSQLHERMQRKPGFPVANCSIKMPDCSSLPEAVVCDDDNEQQQRRQHLINFGHSQWGFNNWNWSVTKQELDFVDFSNGKYCAGVVAFVSVTVKSFDIHRENVGYATSVATNKGLAIYKSRKVAVTNALRETLLSFGGSVATELLELLETHKPEFANTTPVEQLQENNQNIPNKQEPRNYIRKEGEGSPANSVRPKIMNPTVPVPVAKAHPMPVNLPPAANRPPIVAGTGGTGQRPPPPTPVPPVAPRPNSNEAVKSGFEGLSEEEARVERKRRQRVAQEEFRLKQLMKQQSDEKSELIKNCSSFDKLLMDIPTQDIVIEETGDTADNGKRRSPAPEGSAAKRRSSINRLDIVQADRRE